MFDATLHRRVVLVALAALVAFSGAVAGASVTPDVSPIEIDRSSASMAEMTAADENVSAEFVYDGERIVLEQSDDQTVRMRTNADPGTELTIELRVDGNFVTEARAPVAENGTATAALDMRRFDPGTEFVVVGPDGTQADGSVVEESTATDSKSSESDEYSISFGDDPYVLHPAESQTIRVETSADPGTKLDVEVESNTNFWSAAAEVGEDGTATAEFDLSAVESGVELELGTRSDGAEAEARAFVVNETATVDRDGTLAVSKPKSNYTVVGKTNLLPGTEIDVRLTDADSSFSATETVTVAEEDVPFGDRVFTATFDLSSVPKDAELSAEVDGVPRSVEIPYVVTDGDEQTVFAFADAPADATLLESDGTAILVEQQSEQSIPEKTLLVGAAPNRTVRGETNLQPGSELEVRIVSEINSQTPADRSETVTVGDDGRFAASFDFDDVSPGTEFAIEVSHVTGPPLTSMDARVIDGSELPATTTTPDGTEAPFTTAGTDAPTGDTTDGDNDGIVPGFGVSVALAALLAALAVARQREA